MDRGLAVCVEVGDWDVSDGLRSLHVLLVVVESRRCRRGGLRRGGLCVWIRRVVDMRTKSSEGRDSLQAGESADAVGALGIEADGGVLVAIPLVGLEALATVAICDGDSGEG